jgi:3-carboxy-cis,cis-muconate cycloisomerase
MPAQLRDQFASDMVSRHFDDAALIAAMARFEAALALAQADVGLIRSQAAQCIASVCLALDGLTPPPPPFDAASLVPAARRAGTLAIPFVKALTAAVAARDAEAARWVHWGATSQDVLDTALALQAQAAGHELQAQIARTGDCLAELALAHAATPMVGRTLLQSATPITFGWKVAGWLSPLSRVQRSLARALEDAGVLQLGGAAGTRAALNGQGDAVAAALAARLGLNDPPMAWHATRDRVARLGCELALVAGAMAGIGRDISLLMQPEVGEVSEPAGEGRGGSSAMPHKRNPVGSMLAMQAGLRAPGLTAVLLGQQMGEHERGLGSWQGDWWTLGELFECAGSATEAIGECLEGLQVNVAAMHDNLDRTRGFVHAEAVTIALGKSLGKPSAQALMERICEQAYARGQSLRDALAAARASDADLAQALPESRLSDLFDPATQRGDAQRMIERVVHEWRES